MDDEGGPSVSLVLKPPGELSIAAGVPSVFLAGSIEMDRASLWQSRVEQALADLDVVLLNPRRDVWDTSWDQSIENEVFRGQVEWELEAQEQSSWIVMYFDPATRSPITLLELGLAARGGKLLVCCPPGFWRRGNVEVVCARYDVPTFSSLEEMLAALRQRLCAQASGPTL